MHTDEYRITMTREVVHCRSKIKALQKKLTEFERRHGTSTEEFLRRYDKDPQYQRGMFKDWYDTHLALQRWQKTLQEYEELLKKF